MACTLHIYHRLPPAPCLCYAVLDVVSGKVAHTLAGHSGGTNGLAFLSGNSLVSVGEDGTARLWNVARAACVQELPVDAEGADRWAVLCCAVHCAALCSAAGQCRINRKGLAAMQQASMHPCMHGGLFFAVYSSQLGSPRPPDGMHIYAGRGDVAIASTT